MIEEIIRRYLTPLLDPVPVYIEKPAAPGRKYVVIERTGGGMENHIRTAMIAVQSYGGTMEEAAILHEAVLEHMQGMIGLDEIGGISLNSEYNFTDTETKAYRYQAVFDLTYY